MDMCVVKTIPRLSFPKFISSSMEGKELNFLAHQIYVQGEPMKIL